MIEDQITDLRQRIIASFDTISSSKVLSQPEKTFLERLTMQGGDGSQWTPSDQRKYVHLANLFLDK